jgi:hypothetical protein
VQRCGNWKSAVFITRKYRNFHFLDRIFRIKTEKNLVELVNPVKKVPPQAAKFTDSRSIGSPASNMAPRIIATA